MFQAVKKIRQVNFGQLMRVYSQSNLQDARQKYAYLEDGQALLEVEQDHYTFLNEFFKTPGAVLMVWEQDGVYQAALRAEPYADGFLLEGLETAPESRRNGFAKKLLSHTADYLFSAGVKKLYSHVHTGNSSSVKVHEACGFIKLYDYAVFIDGSVDHRTDTYMKRGAD